MESKKCYGCFSDIHLAEECPFCHFKEEEYILPHNALPLGTVLNERYHIGKVLGSGGFGITYIAYDSRLQITVAIKEYLPKSLASREATTQTIQPHSVETKDQFEHHMDKFMEEARAIAKFNHEPGIVSVQDVIELNNTVYIIMGYVSGITLEEYVANHGGKLSLKRTLEIMEVVIQSLAKLHDRDLIHRDISPDNIYITTDHKVKLLDFGAARYIVSEASQSLSVILKPGYAPIEQYSTKGKQGPWTDVYAVTATIYWMLSGIKPQNSMDRMMEDEVLSLRELDLNVPVYVDETIKRGMTVHYQQRIQNLHQLWDLLSDESSTVLLQTLNKSVVQEVQVQDKKIRRSWIPYAATAGFLLAILIPFLISQINKQESPESIESPTTTTDQMEISSTGNDLGDSDSQDGEAETKKTDEETAGEGNADDKPGESSDIVNEALVHTQAVNEASMAVLNEGNDFFKRLAVKGYLEDERDEMLTYVFTHDQIHYDIYYIHHWDYKIVDGEWYVNHVDLGDNLGIFFLFGDTMRLENGTRVIDFPALEGADEIRVVSNRGEATVILEDPVLPDGGKLYVKVSAIFDLVGKKVDSGEDIYLYKLLLDDSEHILTEDYGNIDDYLVIDGNKDIYFEDPIVSELVRNQAGITSNRQLYARDVENLVELDTTNGENISNIRGLENLYNMEVLHLNDANDGDMWPFSHMMNLKVFSYHSPMFSNPEQLFGLTSILELDLSGCSLQYLSPIDKLVTLEKLNLSGSMIRDFSTLKALPNLEYLEIDGDGDYDDFEYLDQASLSTIKNIQ